MIQILEFSPQIIYLGLTLIVLLILSATISGSETAFFSLSPSDLQRLDKDDSKGAQKARMLLHKPEMLLSTILIFNNLINIGAILVANSMMDHIFDFGGSTTWEFVVKIVVVTFILLLFGEIMPKIFSNSRTYRIATIVAPFLVGIRWVLWPFSWILTSSGAIVTKTLGGNREAVSMDTLQEAIEITDSETPQDKKMLSGIVQFVQTEVVEIMKPRIDVHALDTDWDFERVKKEIINSPYSRLPLYDDSVDKIKGIIYIKDLLPYLNQGEGFEWQKLAREAYFVPENMKINDLLEEFQARKKHVCIVVDEYGGTLGIATLEDVLEEIVGDISDESDVATEFYKNLGGGNYLFDGGTHLVDFERALSMVDHDMVERSKGESDTLAGLMLELKGDFFKVGETVLMGTTKFRAEEVDGYRIKKVVVSLPSNQ